MTSAGKEITVEQVPFHKLEVNDLFTFCDNFAVEHEGLCRKVNHATYLALGVTDKNFKLKSPEEHEVCGTNSSVIRYKVEQCST